MFSLKSETFLTVSLYSFMCVHTSVCGGGCVWRGAFKLRCELERRRYSYMTYACTYADKYTPRPFVSGHDIILDIGIAVSVVYDTF